MNQKNGSNVYYSRDRLKLFLGRAQRLGQASGQSAAAIGSNEHLFVSVNNILF